MDSMPLLDDDFNFNEINLDFLESPPRLKLSAPSLNVQKCNLEKNPINDAKQIAQDEFKVCKTENNYFNLDFLESLQEEKYKLKLVSENALQSPCTTGKRTKTEKQSNVNSSSALAKRIADVDTLVRQLQAAEEEKKALKKQMEDFNQSAKEIHLLYNKERNSRIEADIKNKTLKTQCDNLETELAAKTLELDQVQAQFENCNGPILYSELAIRFIKLAQKLDEERLLHWHDQPLFKDIERYCKDKNLKIPKITPRSPPKRKACAVKKIEAATQCELLTLSNFNNEKSKVKQRHQSTQSIPIETRNQGSQHIGTTTTRSTTTSCFFKYHDVGINCSPVDLEPAFDAILDEIRSFGDRYAPLSPIPDISDEDNITLVDPILSLSPIPQEIIRSKNESIRKLTCSIGINTSPQHSIERKTIGSCTYICNVQRPLDFLTQPTPICIKRSNSRPPSTGLPFETVKDESNSRSCNTSPINFNMNSVNNLLPPVASSSTTILPSAFDELWQIFGHMLYGLLNRRLLTPANPNNITNQQDFYNWLNTLYSNAQTSQANLNQNINSSDSIGQQQCSTSFAVPNNESATSSTHSMLQADTPLSFSDEAPNVRTVPNVIKPTALRNNVKDADAGKEEYLPSSTQHRTIATSPIHYLSTSPNLLHEATANEMPKNTRFIDAEKSEKESAFERVNIESNKRFLTTETSFCFRKGVLNKNLRNLKDEENSKILGQKERNNKSMRPLRKNCHKSKRQKLNYTLFGSESETDSEIEIPSEPGIQANAKGTTIDACTTGSSDEETKSESVKSSNSSCRFSPSYSDEYDEERQPPLQIVDDFNNEEKVKVFSENDFDFPASQNESDENKMLNSDSFQNITTQADELETVLKPKTAFHIDDFLSDSPKRRGRKRKKEITLETPASPSSSNVVACKRSPRLLAKQVNQQIVELKNNASPLNLNNKSESKTEHYNTNANLTAFVSYSSRNNDSAITSFSKVNNLTRTTHKSSSFVAIKKTFLKPSEESSLQVSATKSQSSPKQCKEALPSANNINENSSSTAISTAPTTSAVVSLKNLNLKSKNLSKLFTTPYALRNTFITNTNSNNTSKNLATTTSNKKSTANVGTPEQLEPTTLTKSDFHTRVTTTRENVEAVFATNESADQNQELSYYSTVSQALATNATILTKSGLLSSTTRTKTTIERDANEETTANSVIAAQKTNNSVSDSKPIRYDVALNNQANNSTSFNSPPASPLSFETEDMQTTIKKIPLELSTSKFPTWRRWRHHQRSLLHNLISAYDAKLYQGLQLVKSNESKKSEHEKLQQMQVHIVEYIRQMNFTNETPTSTTHLLPASQCSQNVSHLESSEATSGKYGFYSSDTTTTTDIKVTNLKEKLQKITNESKLIAKAILIAMQKQQRPKILAYEQYVNDKPATTTIPSTITIYDALTNQTFSTYAHRSCFYILKQYSNELLSELLQQIEGTLFDIKNADNLKLCDALNLTDLYLLALQQQSASNLNDNSNPARLFIAKCLYYHKLKASPMIYAVLCAFPTVLPHREEHRYDRSDALITVIQHCLMCNTYDMNNSELLQRELLSKLRFQYHFECFKPDFQQVLQNLIEKLCAGKLENLKFAFAILCKRLPPERVVRDVIQQHFIPLANEYYRLSEQNVAYELRMAAMLDCFSTVIKPFPRDSSIVHDEIPKYLNFFKRFLTMIERPRVQEAAIHAILRLQRFDILNCYQALAHLRLEFELQPNTKAALRTFIYRKPLSFWKALILQST